MDFRKLADEFHERGVLIVEKLFDGIRLDEIELELARYIGQLDPIEANGRVVYESGPEQKIRNIFDLNQDNEYFASLANTPELINLVRTIFDDEPVLLSVELFGKPARVGSEVPYHQDNAYFNLIPDHALTIWLALADATLENGCVRYLEGTHKLSNLPHRPSGVKGNSMKLCDFPAGNWREVCGVLKRGGSLIHHCNTIHRSEPNNSDRDRPGLLFVYKAARCNIDESRARKYRQAAAAV